jgi:hypothetical protein
VRARLSIPVVTAATLGAALLTIGVIYLTVACQSLPGFLGPVHGDTSPRTGLGITAVVLALIVFAAGFLITRRRPPGGPAKP